MKTLRYGAIATAAVLWAFGGTLARTLIDRGASALEITEARAWLAALGIGAVLLLRGRHEIRGTASRATLIFFGLAIAAANYTYYTAIASLPVAVAIVIQYTAPALVVVWIAVETRTRPSWAVARALVLALAGVSLLAELPDVVRTGTLELSGTGMLAAAASAVAFACYVVLGERITRTMGSVDAMFWGFVVAGAFWAAVQLSRGRPDTLLDPSFTSGIVVIALVSTIAPFLLFLWGVGGVGASRAGIVSTLEPVSAAGMAFVWLDQALTLLQLLGAAMVVTGIVIVQIERTEAAPVPAPLE